MRGCLLDAVGFVEADGGLRSTFRGAVATLQSRLSSPSGDDGLSAGGQLSVSKAQ